MRRMIGASKVLTNNSDGDHNATVFTATTGTADVFDGIANVLNKIDRLRNANNRWDE